LHSWPEIRETVVWIISADRELEAFHVRLTDAEVTLERPYPPGVYLWSLPDWNFSVDVDGRGVTGTFSGFNSNPGPRDVAVGIEYAPDDLFTAALLRAEATYTLNGEEHTFTAVPEPAIWAFIPPLVLAACGLLRRRRAPGPASGHPG
jgi:hypothetical protein